MQSVVASRGGLDLKSIVRWDVMKATGTKDTIFFVEVNVAWSWERLHLLALQCISDGAA